MLIQFGGAALSKIRNSKTRVKLGNSKLLNTKLQRITCLTFFRMGETRLCFKARSEKFKLSTL